MSLSVPDPLPETLLQRKMAETSRDSNELPSSSKPAPLRNYFSRHKFISFGVVFLLLAAIIGVSVVVLGSKTIFKTPLPPFGGGSARLPTGGLKMKALASDSLGVSPDSGFVLSGQEKLSTGQVKSALVVNPAFDYKIKKLADKEIGIIPTKVLSKDTVYQFRLANQTASVNDDLSWAFQIKSSFHVIGSLPKNKSSHVPLNSGLEITFSHDNFQAIDKYFSISPPLDGYFEHHKRTVVFVHKEFKPTTLYTVTVRKGLGLDGSNDKLKEDFVFQFETDNKHTSSPQAYLSFAKSFAEFPPTEKPVLGFYTYSIPENSELSFEVFNYPDQGTFLKALFARDTLPVWAQVGRENYLYPTDGLTKVSTFKAPLQKGQYQSYVVFPENLRAGYYLVQARYQSQVKQLILQVTDVAVFLTTSDTKTIVWMNDVASGQAVFGAKVSLTGSDLQKFTNKQGVIDFETPQELKKSDGHQFFIVTAPLGQSVVIPATYTKNSYSYGDYWNRPHQEAENYWSYLYLDRSLYSSNDKINFWGIVKHRDQPQKRSTLKVQLVKPFDTNYAGETVTLFSEEIKPTDLGTFHSEIPIQNISPGYYTVQVLVDNLLLTSNGLSVEDYTKPAYKILVKPEKRAIFAGETVILKGSVLFFEGTPVPKVQLKYSGDLEGEVTSDENGKFQVFYSPIYQDGEQGQYPKTSWFKFRPKLSEEGEIIGGARVRVYGSRIDLSAQTSLKKGSNEVELKIIPREIDLEKINNSGGGGNDNHSGKLMPGQTIEGKIYVNRWERKAVGEYYDFINKKVRKTYTYKHFQDLLREFSVVAQPDGQATYTFKVEPEKSYEIRLTAKDLNGRTARAQTYAYGSAYASFGTRDTNYYYLTFPPNVSSFGVSEQVLIKLKNGKQDLPVQKSPRYLFTLAQRGIKNYELKNKPTLEFKFASEYVPNIIAGAVYFNGRTYLQTPPLNVPFRKNDKKLDIEIKPDKISYKPVGKVNLKVLVKDKDKAGQAAEINLSLVDEALFALQDQTVDTLGDLYQNVGSGIIQSYASHQYLLNPIAAGGGAACFLQGTPIKMANGTYRPIEEIKAGDLISTRQNEHNDKMVSAKVVKTKQHVVGFILLINNTLWVTPEHRLFINGKWQEIGAARVGDVLMNENGQNVPITSIQQKFGKFVVYNLKIKKYRTFLANGFYVHNDKGREFFADQAFFGVVKTDASGHGQTSFTLPDNLTSWRITYQGVSSDLKAGSGKKQLLVRLPFFIEASLNKQYLVSDKPIVELRSFGERLQKGQKVQYQIKAPSLGVEAMQTVEAKAFETVEYKLPKLKPGRHKITITSRTGNLSDTVTRTIRVYESYLVKADAKFGELATNIHLGNVSDLPTTLVFTDRNRGRFYHILSSLSYGLGDRIDQRLTRIESAKLLRDYFGEGTISNENFDGAKYQVAGDGGIALFPYSSSEVELSAKVAALATDKFDKTALLRYFLKVAGEKKSGPKQTAAALYGLAVLHEPVLVPIQHMVSQNGLPVTSRLYLALGMAKLGDNQGARAIYKEILEKYGEEIPPFLRLNVGKNQDDILQSTALAAELAGILAESKRDALYQYVDNNYTDDILIDLEKLTYVKQALSLASQKKVAFSYTLNNQTQTKTLEKGQIFKLILTPDQLKEIKFSDIQGRVGLTQLNIVPLNASTIKKSRSISIARTYQVGDHLTQDFQEADLIKIQLTPRLGPKALDGCYQVTDYLPSGLKPILDLASYGVRDKKTWYPYEVNGQKISFCVYKAGYQIPITYYARVISKGDFLGEGTLIQSQKSAQDIDLGQAVKVKIQ